MKKLLISLFLLSLASLLASGPERSIALATAKQNAKRLAEFQNLQAHAAASQHQVDAFLAEWQAACNPGQPRGDGGCQAPAPKPAPPVKADPPKEQSK